MTNTFSLFHHLQKAGSRALEIMDVKDEFRVSAEPFFEKIQNAYRDPFPIFVIPKDTGISVWNRIEQMFASTGIFIDETVPDLDRSAAFDLRNEEICRARLPARRFGVELLEDPDETVGMVFEALKDSHTPYRAQEFDGKTILDCQFLRVHFVFDADYGPGWHPDSPLRLFSHSFVLNIPKLVGRPTEEYLVTHNPLLTDSIRVRGGPFQGRKAIPASELFSYEIEDDFDIKNIIVGRMQAVFNVLWTLDREAKLLVQDTNEFKEQNRSRRQSGRSQYSHVHTLKIDPDELRRVESHRASEIAYALANKGGYKIPGLVLVTGYDRQDTGKKVEDYARCAEEIVRREATNLLRNKDYEQLAVLVRDFGNRTTRARMAHSDIFVTKMFRTPKNG